MCPHDDSDGITSAESEVAFVSTATDFEPTTHDEAIDCPRSIGRYLVLRRLGAGGMGVVYAAYDELLERRIAIKVLHERVWDIEGRKRERLRREAQAMARVTHPNVITVHEVGTADGQLFIAMEFVEGPTLREWLAARARSWQEIVAVGRQVADGLAAVHDAGLVHRDVKPSNVLIGDDGRVRVLDLGLALESDASVELFDSQEESPSQRLTRTGAKVGTPAYMSSEQLLGGPSTPATDTFALSVVLYEALYGVHPFMAPTFEELQHRVLTCQINAPRDRRAVPAWLHALVVQGLAPNPAERPPSMHALSVALSKDPDRIRGRWVGAFGVAVLAAMIVIVMRPDAVVPRACDGGATAVSAAWSTERANEVRAAILAVDRPYTAELAERVTDGITDYAGAWAAAHDRSCREHARGDFSDALFDARMACLDRHRASLSETVDLLARADVDVVEHAGQLIAKLPRLSACDERERLARDGATPTNPKLAELERRLVRAEALANGGRLDESANLARQVATEAERLDQPSLVARALLAEARLEVLHFDRPSVEALIDRALVLSTAEHRDDLAAEAMVRRLYLRGLSDVPVAAALADVPFAEAMIVRAGDDPELRVLLLNNVGALHAAAGDRKAARDAFSRALTIKERLFGDQHLEVALGLANLGMMTPDPVERRELHARLIAIHEHWLGPDHPRTLDARLLAAFHTADPEVASADLERLCPAFRAVGAPEYGAECEFWRGRIELARGRAGVARGAFEAAHELLGHDADRRVLVDAYSSLNADDPKAAITALAEQIARLEQRGDAWWLRLDQAEHQWLLGRLYLQHGHASEAVATLEQALANLDAIAEQAQPIERERLLADTRLFLARALALADPEQRDRITRLSHAARNYYLQWPRAYAARIAELESTHSGPVNDAP